MLNGRSGEKYISYQLLILVMVLLKLGSIILKYLMRDVPFSSVEIALNLNRINLILVYE